MDHEELLEKIKNQIDLTKEELFKRMNDKMEKNNEKLWQKVQEQMKKDKKELKNQMDTMQKEDLEFREEMRNFRKEMKDQMHIIKDVNLPHIIDQVTKTRKELKQTENRLEVKLDQSIEGHEVKHKKIEYELAELKWKTKVAN